MWMTTASRQTHMYALFNILFANFWSGLKNYDQNSWICEQMVGLKLYPAIASAYYSSDCKNAVHCRKAVYWSWSSVSTCTFLCQVTGDCARCQSYAWKWLNNMYEQRQNQFNWQLRSRPMHALIFITEFDTFAWIIHCRPGWGLNYVFFGMTRNHTWYAISELWSEK